MTTAAAALRTAMRERRRALRAPVRLDAANRVAERVLALPWFPTQGHIGGYWAVDGELGLHALLLGLPPGVRYCLPLLNNDNTLRFAPWRAGDALTHNRFGIPEPAVLDAALLSAGDLSLVIVPLVAFDAACCRIGMGGGWYDRTFAAPKGAQRPRLVGVGYDCQRIDAIVAEPWDVPMDAVCTESATYLPPETATT